MQFQLPQKLQVELLAYDPKLKALARTQNPKKTSKKSTHRLGNPNDIIPPGIIRLDKFQRAIDRINTVGVSERYVKFTKFTKGDQPIEYVYAILYHYEQCWYAAWIAPEDKKDEYVYGYAYAYKDNDSTWKSLLPVLRREKDTDQEGNIKERTYGRTKFLVRQGLITKQDIINAHSPTDVSIIRWNIPSVPHYYQKSGAIRVAINAFQSGLARTLPTWTDTNGIFERLRTNTLGALLIPGLTEQNLDTWQPSFESLCKLIQFPKHLNMHKYHTYQAYVDLKRIIDTPFFRRWIQDKCTQCILKFNDPSTDTQKDIKQPWNLILRLLEAMNQVNTIWPDCPIDYYQNNIDALLGVDASLGYRAGIDSKACKKVGRWLNKYMPVASYFSLLSKFYEESEAEDKPSYMRDIVHCSSIGINVYRFSALNDTINMLYNILSNQAEDAEDFAPPRRWRIAEFHDYVQGEAWKIHNKNEALPQDLFPTPVKVTVDDATWTFFQPIDTHQLANWGQAVRNCVGASSTYADLCKKKKHFIVLSLVNGKPIFTIQLTVEMGNTTVKQIAGISNQRLDDQQKEQFAKAFEEALQIRDTQVSS